MSTEDRTDRRSLPTGGCPSSGVVAVPSHGLPPRPVAVDL